MRRYGAAIIAATIGLLGQRSEAQSVISVGAGSYASSVPPACQETDSYYGLPADQVTGANGIYNYLHLDPSLVGKPIPTNHWWTDMLIGDRSYLPAGQTEYVLQQSPYGGNMWVYPGRLNAQSYGFDLYYPVAWEGANPSGPNGTIDSGPALPVHGDRGYAVPSSDILVADFENGYPAGWTTTNISGYPSAFGTAPAQGTWTGQSPTPSGYLGNGLVNTYLTANNQGSNANEGILSGSFTVQKHYLHFLVAGGSDTANTVVRLRVNGNIVATATGQQDAVLRWATWDVSAYANKTATLEIVDTSSAGWGFILCDEIVQSDVQDPTGRYGTDYSPTNAVVTNWGDWNVDFKLPDASGEEVDVTMARGIPFTWTTWKGGLKPKLLVGSGTQFLNTSGGTISTAGGSFVAGSFAFNYQGRVYGVFLPDNTTVTVNADGSIEPQLSGANNYMVVGYLPAASNLAEFNTVAFARPTNTQVSWSYVPSSGYVATTWNITSTAMKGSNLNTIQGWLPHHYRTTTGLPTFSSYTYQTPRGIMKCATGTNFTINFPFNGLVPVSPVPAVTTDANPYQPARMQAYLNAFAPGTMIGDTYWSGKALALCSQYMSWAKQTGDTADYTRLKSALEAAFANWLTYTPGETNGFFAYYNDWHALVGWDASYGSQAFNDLHFHYGYFTTAAATLALYDPAFVANYAPMLRTVAKGYANYDRNDASEPFLRMFDVWEGHSNAGGVSSPNGENQESSSEAMQGWAGLFMLGGVLNDSQMNSAGAMGFAMEAAATNEYWEDLWQTNFPPAYNRAYAGQVYGDSYNYGTFFSGDPAWVYGIQYGPSNHWLNYLTRFNPSTVTAKYNAMWTERNNWGASYPTWNNATAYPQYTWISYNHKVYAANNAVAAGKPSPDQDATDWGLQADYSASEPDVLGDSPGHVVLCYQAIFDPNTAAAEFDKYYANNEAIASLGSQAGSSYYLIHSMRQLGQQDFTASTSSPLSSVYYNSKTGKYSYLVYNPSTSQQNVTVYRNGASVGTFAVPAQTLIDSHLDEALTSLTLTAANTSQTVTPGQTVQFTLTGYDQYGATYPLSGTTWSVNAGGTINSSGLFTATTNAYPVTVTAASGGLSKTYTFRVGAAPVLNAIAVTPGFMHVIQGSTAQYSAVGTDQYGNAYPLGSVTWSVAGVGTVNGTGLYTASALGTGYVTATSGGVSGSVLVATHAALANVALNRPVVASTVNAPNLAANLVDGNTTTRWESATADNQWIYVDLGKTYDLTNVTIDWETAYASNYEIQVSTDASTWTDALPAISPASGLASNQHYIDSEPLNGAAGRYVRLKLNTRTTGYGFSVWELQVYGYVDAASITTSTVKINPAGVAALVGQQTQFQAYAFDANFDGGPATATWSVSGGGTINSSGLFSATTAGGPFTVSALAGGVTGTTQVTVSAPASGATNIALNQAATASSSENSGTTPNYAVDGNTGTRWSSAFTDTEWITVDLGASQPLSQVVLNWEAAYGKQYKIQGSNDNATWTTLYTQSNGPGGVETLNVSGSYRYVKMQGVQRATQYGYSLWELQIMSTSPMQKTNKALNKAATSSSSENSGTTPNDAVDGNLGTRWSSAFTDTEWITVNLGSATAFTQVVLNWEAAYGKQYKIQGSNDNATWTTLYTQTNGPGGTETINAGGTYQYVRMQGVQRATQYGYSLWELQVY